MSAVAGPYRPRKAEARNTPAFVAGCVCGRRLEGSRKPTPQSLRCPDCGETVFIFPASPLVDLLARSGKARAGPGRRPVARRRPISRSRAILYGLIAVVLLCATGVLLYRLPGPDSAAPLCGVPPTPAEANEHAERALSEGAYGEAAERLGEWLTVARGRPDLASPGQLRSAEELARQAALMRDLCAESLPEILRSARGLSDRAWREQFRNRYQGKALVFDTLVCPDGTGDYLLDWRFPEGDGDVRLSLRGMRLLDRAVRADCRRLLFGFRVADARRDPRGGWVVRADPESGVLLTHPRILAGTSLATDAELAGVLKRQAE